MAKFPTKTLYELQVYFSNLTLQNLLEINRSYGPHFVNLEERIENTESSIVQKGQLLQRLVEDKLKLEAEAPALEEQDKRYYRTRDDMRESLAGAELYLANQYIGLSPSIVHKDSTYRVSSQMNRVSEDISDLDTQLNRLNASKLRAIEELRLLNRIIEDKKEELVQSNQKSITL